MAVQGRAHYIAPMDLATYFDNVAAFIASIPRYGLLLATLVAIFISVTAGLFRDRAPVMVRSVRAASTVVLGGILVLVVLQVSRFDPRFDMAIPEIGLPEQAVVGGETRVPLAPDGHFWVRASVNGVPADFLVDTGATLTTLNEDTAAQAGVVGRKGGIPVMMQTANGPVTAELTTIDELSFGNVSARGLDAAIAPNIGKTNVLGMNLLSRLGSWRVEKQTMILTPEAETGAEPQAGN